MFEETTMQLENIGNGNGDQLLRGDRISSYEEFLASKLGLIISSRLP